MKTIQQWADDAHGHVQFACNLSGIVFALAQCVEDLTAEAKRLGKDNDWIDHHPICVVWSDKFDDLSRSRGLDPLSITESLVTLVPAFVEVMQQLCNESHRDGHGTDWRNQHPRAQECARKIVFVTGSRDSMNVFRALEGCEQLASGDAVVSESSCTENVGLKRN